MTFHLAGAECLSVGRDQRVRVGWLVRALCQAKRGYGP